MNYKPEELLKKLHKGDQLANLIVCYGEEDYYRKRIAAAVQNYVFGDMPEEDRQLNIFEKDTNLGELEGVINSYPFFCPKALVILKDEKLLGKAEGEAAKKQQERLGNILKDIPEYCLVFILTTKLDKRTKFFKDLEKQGAMCSCDAVKAYNVGDWLHQKAEALGGMLSRDAEQTILEYIEPLETAPLQLLEQELEKLAIYAGDRKRWGKEDVETIFAELPEVGRFALTNALAERKLAKVLEILASEKKRKTPIILLCGSIMYQLRRLLQIKELLNKGYNVEQVGEAMNMKFPAIRNKSVNQARRFEQNSLEDALLNIAQLNIDLRTGGRDYERLEEIMVKLLN